MIKMTYDQVSTENFVQAMQKLTRMNLPVKLAYHIKKITDDLNKVKSNISTEFKAEIVDKFMIPAPVKEGSPEGTKPELMLDPAKLEEFEKAKEEFGKREFEVNRHPIHISNLDRVEISARDLSALDPLLTEELMEANVVQFPPSA